MARKKALEVLGEDAYTGGYSLYTTIIAEHQDTAQKAIQNGLITYDQRHGYRGPEGKLSLELINSSQSNQGDLTPDYSPWQEQIAKKASYGKLQAAAVISLEEKSLVALLGSGE